MGKSRTICFPCETIPNEPAEARLLGIYPQRQQGLLMQRVKVPGGRIRPDQWRGLAELARRHAPDYPLHLTTRQDIEFHGVRSEDLPAVQRGCLALGLTALGACGDSVRNITVCPENGFCRRTWDVFDLAESIRTHVELLSWIRSLPRKFKISVSGCPKACARPWINDIGLIANPDGTFHAVVGASLGGRPLTGLLMYDSLAVREILPLVVALLRLFHAEGDRHHRTRARLRHVRERIGDEAFRKRVCEFFRTEKKNLAGSTPRLRRVEVETRLQARLSLPLGDIDPDTATELGERVEATGAELRLGLEHDLFLFGNTSLVLSPTLNALADAAPIVACPGSTWCTRGITASRDAAKRIQNALPKRHDLTIAIAGCPNNCSQAVVADVGLIGRIRRVGNARSECYRFFAGGGKGKTPAIARELHPAVPVEEVGESVALLAQEYRKATETGQMSFGDFVVNEFDHLVEAMRRCYGRFE